MIHVFVRNVHTNFDTNFNKIYNYRKLFGHNFRKKQIPHNYQNYFALIILT